MPALANWPFFLDGGLYAAVPSPYASLA